MAEPSWQSQENPLAQGNPLVAVWGSSGSNVFAVGPYGTILHYDGQNWSPMNSDTANHLGAVWGTSGSDVFAAGTDGTILRYDGSTWSPMDSGTSKDLYAVWGSFGSNVFAVGLDGTILHYDGQNWSPMNSGTSAGLWGVWGSSSSDVFAVGDGGTILHYDGNDDSNWSLITSGMQECFYAVWGSSERDIFAMSNMGTILHYNGTTWTSMTGTHRNNKCLAVWGSSASDVFAVGATDLILHYDGSNWNPMPHSTFCWEFHGVWGSSGISGIDVFAVGHSGTILHYRRINTYTIHTSASPGGTISPSGEVMVEHGANQTFMITPQTGYSIARVIVDGVSVRPVSSYTFPNVTTNHTLVVFFEQIPQVPILNLTIGMEGQGTTDPMPGVYRYEEGTQVTITASPDPGWKFDHWYGAASGDSPTATITMSGHTTVMAHFEKIPVVAPLYIANTNTPIPGGTGNFTSFEDPSFHGDSVAFVGCGSSGQQGIYLFRDGSLTVVVDGNTPVPGGSGNFMLFRREISLNGDDVAFVGLSMAEQPGLYLFRDGSLTVVADRNTPAPDGSGNLGEFEQPSLHGGNVAFLGLSPSGSWGIYIFRGGSLTLLADFDTPVPGGSGNFSYLDLPSLKSGDIAFIGRGPSGQAGVYLFRDGSLTVLADRNTPVPSGSGNFNSFGYPLIDGSDVTFHGLDSYGHNGIYLFRGGLLNVVADFNTPIPGGSSNFVSVESASFSDGNVAFRGSDSSWKYGIYIAIGGLVHRLIGEDDFLDNKTVSNVTQSKEALSENAIAFGIRFADSTTGIYRYDFGTKVLMDSYDALLAERILQFFNKATRIEIINRVGNDPNYGASSRRAWGIPPSLFGSQIRDARNALPGGRFATLQQIKDIWGMGLDTFHDILYSFHRGDVLPDASYDTLLAEKVLQFFNQVADPDEIVNRIHDDPNFGTPSGWAIRRPLAQQILDARDTLPSRRFASLQQINDISGVGFDTFHDILYSFQRPEPSPPPEEVIVDFTSVGRGVPFAHDHFESVGIVFTKSSEFSGFVQGDEALISSGGQIAADILQGFFSISVSVAATLQGLWVFTLTAFDNSGEAINQTSLSLEETGSAGYQVLSLSDLSGAVSFEVSGTKDREPGQYGVNEIRFTSSG